MVFLIGIFGAMFGYLVSREPSRVRVGSPTPSSSNTPPATAPSFIKILAKIVMDGKQPSQGLISAAIEEAYRKGKWNVAEAISNTFDTDDMISESNPEESKSELEAAPEKEEFDPTSPIEGIHDEDWKEFVDGMKTEEPTFETDKHKGAFHHHKKRLEQLGVKEAATLKDQYNALVKDILDLKSKYGDMLGKHVTSEIKIDKDTHVITASGMLGLLKAAGPKGAEKWLKGDEVTKFPKTTEVFLRTNGRF